MEEARHDIPLYREFALLGTGIMRLPDVSTILRLRHLLEAHELSARMLATVNQILQAKGLMLKLKAGSAVDATLISASSSTNKAVANDRYQDQEAPGYSEPF
ncbi:transposase (fragment) [Paraburkholderia piptadeniae]|uniref:Transposase n=1 Tax=Paraburkholderia piptadeniae TaxID=1701573 RepID=A0A1N7RVP2_9BURK